MIVLALVASVGTAQVAELVGPPVPAPPKQTPAEQAIALYHAEWAHRTPAPCPVRGRNGEIVVCADGRGNSPDRLPLPDERGPPDHARQPIGEVPSARGMVDLVSSASPPPGGDAPATRAAEKLLVKAAGKLLGGNR